MYSTAKAISQSTVPAPGAAGDDGTSSFTHTKVIVQKGKRFYNAYTSHPLWNTIDEIETSFLDIDLFPILLSEYCHLPPADVLLAPDPVPDSYHRKRFKPSDQGSQAALQEIEMWERLRGHPNDRIATYHGVVLEEDYVVAVCFQKYPQTVVERLYHDKREFDNTRLLDEIREGLDHLHHKNLVHNDINPSNILIDKYDKAVIFNSGSCCDE